MWQPEPGWVALRSGTGTSTVGVWRTVLGGRPSWSSGSGRRPSTTRRS